MIVCLSLLAHIWTCSILIFLWYVCLSAEANGVISKKTKTKLCDLSWNISWFHYIKKGIATRVDHAFWMYYSTLTVKNDKVLYVHWWRQVWTMLLLWCFTRTLICVWPTVKNLGILLINNKRSFDVPCRN